ncbi:MAG: hypothetical protein ACE5GJ_08280 [Gemmatimonadota bacterium]
MKRNNSLGDVIFMVALILFAVVLVDERWIRTAVALVPALLLAQRALAAGEDGPASVATGPADRRRDGDVRRYIDDLLKNFREFYATTHLMATGALDPEEAKDRAAGIERRLNALLAEVTEAARSGAGGS